MCVCVHGEVYCTLSFSPPSHIRARRIECQMSSIVAVTQCQLPSIPSYIFFFLPPVIWFFLFDFSYQKSTWPSSTRLSTQVTGSARKNASHGWEVFPLLPPDFFFFCGSCGEVWISFALANGNFQSVDYDQSCLINGLNRTEPKNEKKNSIELNGWGKFMWALCSACADTINDGVTCFRLSTRFPHSLHSFGLCLIHARDIDICMK